MGAAQTKDAAHVRGQRRCEPQGSNSRARAARAAPAATAQGGAVVPQPPPSAADRLTPQPRDGGRGRGTDGLSSAAAAADRKGKKPISASDDREQARRKEERKSGYPKEKFLGSSIRAYQGPGNEKLSDRKGEQPNCPSQFFRDSIPKSVPHVYHKKIPMGDAVYHYFSNIDDALQRPEVCLRLKFLDRHYSEFRLVVPDGECFYRSFIFSYLEQAVDRIDTRHEDRLLAAVRELAGRAEHFQWASEFSRRREAFERLIEKITGWKRMRDYPTSRVSYNSEEFLLKFFSNYDTTDDIFAFLRLVAATWMCTYRRKFERRVIPLGEGRGLEDWCSTLVIPHHAQAYWIIIRALAEALRVAVRVENVNDGTSENTHYNAIHGTPHVTLLCIGDKYDILYPLPQGEDDSAAETSSGRAGQGVEDPAAETSTGRAARASGWWFGCCFVPKKSRSQGSTGSARSSHQVQRRPTRTEPKQTPHWLTSPSPIEPKQTPLWLTSPS